MFQGWSVENIRTSRNSGGCVHRASAAKLTKYVEEVVWCHFFCQILDVKNLWGGPGRVILHNDKRAHANTLAAQTVDAYNVHNDGNVTETMTFIHKKISMCPNIRPKSVSVLRIIPTTYHTHYIQIKERVNELSTCTDRRLSELELWDSKHWIFPTRAHDLMTSLNDHLANMPVILIIQKTCSP